VRRAPAVLLTAALMAGCSPGTRRPPFGPMPESRAAALEVTIPDATRRLAEALKAAGIPVTRTELRDGYVESAWFDTASMQPVTRRPLGAGVVRVRGWVDPSEYGFSQMTVEAVYRPVADPSLPPRDLERAVPYDHPTRRRLREALGSMGARTIGSEPDAPRPVVATAAAPRAGTDTTQPPRKGGRTPDAPATPPDRPRRGAPGAAPRDTAAAAARRADAAARDTTSRDTNPRDTTTRAAAPRDSTPRDSTPRDSARAPAVAAPAPAPPAPRRTPGPTLPQARGGFAVQVAAAATRVEAEAIAARLRTLDETPQIVAEGGLFKVRTSGYPTRAAANARLARMRGAFAGAFVVAPR